jgi:molybdopterin-guanine dinucleotide biosynthesis protein A
MDLGVSVIVLAGGSSSRMGTDKAFLKLGDRTLVEHILQQVETLSDDLLLVGGDLDRMTGLPARLVEDEPGPSGALLGLYSGLKAARSDLALAIACDMPFLNLRLIRYMVLLAHGHDVVVPRMEDYLEPLHAIYRKSCLGAMEALLQQGKRRITAFYPDVHVRYVDRSQLAIFDPAHRSFVNVNTPEQWEQALRLWKEE